MKKLIIGIIIGLVLGTASNAFAAVGDRVTAVFADFSYMVDGEQKTLDAPVLVHDGNSYLRTTQIANMLGFDVTYKADSRTIVFDSPDPNVTPLPTPTSEPSPSPASTPTDTVTPSPSPTPSTEPSNVAQCQAIRDDYAGKIAMVEYSGLKPGPMALEKLNLEYARDKELSAAGC